MRIARRFRRRSIQSGLFCSLLTVAGALAASAEQELEVTARMAPELIGVDQMSRFAIEVVGSGIGSRRFEPEFELDNLEIEAGPSQSQSFSFVNGVASRSESLSWVVRPMGVGTARVHSIKVRIGDTVYEPADVEIQVQEGAVGRAPPQRGRIADPFEDFFPPHIGRLRRGATVRPEVFLRAEIAPRDPWVGQQALYTLYLYTQAHIASINPERLPEFSGFWVRELDLSESPEVEMVDVDGQRFGRVPVLRRAVFPLRPGELELEAAKVQLSVRIPDRTFGSMFSDVEQIRRDSNPLTLVARPLPPGAPADYSGAVGELQIATELEPEDVAVGEAATFSVTLSGAGHLQGLPAPRLPELDGLRTFPPQQDSDERVVGNQVRGRRTWSFVLVPEAARSFDLPAIEVPYFEPRSGRYEIARAAPAVLDVVPGDAPAVEVAQTAEPGVAAEDPGEPAKPGVGSAAALPTLAAANWIQLLPWLLVTLLLATLSAILVRRRPRNDRRSGARVLDAALDAAAAETSGRQAAARIEEGWRRYLETRWAIPPGTASTQWSKQLMGTEVPAEAAEQLVALADDLHYLRYAPQLADTESLTRELILRSQKLSRSLQ